MKYGLGRVIDETARVELIVTASPFELEMFGTFKAPLEIDHRGWLKVENQRNMGSCSGHAIAYIQAVLNYLKTKSIIQLSRMFGYLAGQQMDGLLGQDNGATITGSVKGAMQLGCCLETTFPYPDRYTQTIPQAAKDEAIGHLIQKHAIMRNYADCFAWLATGTGAIEIGIMWTASLADNKTGVIDQQTGSTYGGHALAVVGFSTRTDSQGRKYLWMINSHDVTWGKNGWAEVAPALFDKWCRDGQSEVIGVTDLKVFGSQRWIGKFDLAI